MMRTQATAQLFPPQLTRPSGDVLPPGSEEIVELSLLLPAWQAEALEAAAHGRGLTTGQMLRSIIREFTRKRN